MPDLLIGRDLLDQGHTAVAPNFLSSSPPLGMKDMQALCTQRYYEMSHRPRTEIRAGHCFIEACRRRRLHVIKGFLLLGQQVYLQAEANQPTGAMLLMKGVAGARHCCPQAPNLRQVEEVGVSSKNIKNDVVPTFCENPCGMRNLVSGRCYVHRSGCLFGASGRRVSDNGLSMDMFIASEVPPPFPAAAPPPPAFPPVQAVS